MSRHNRRRTRGGRKQIATRAMPDVQVDSYDNEASLVPAFSSVPRDVHSMGAMIPDVITRVPATPQRKPLQRSSTISARAWHNRYIAWQNRDRKQQEEKARLETEKERIFGGPAWGDDGDDAEDLEGKMLEYFGGLEWLDT